MVSFDGFALGCFWRKVFITSTESGKTSLVVPSSRSQFAAFTFPSRTSLASILTFSSVVCGFCRCGKLFWMVLVLFRSPSTPLFSQRFKLFSTWDFISDILHLFEVLCNIREGITIKDLRQISQFGDFEDHLFICFVSSLIKAFPGTPFGRSKRFLFQCTNSLNAFSFSSQYSISLSGSVPIIVTVPSSWSIAWFSLQNQKC